MIHEMVYEVEKCISFEEEDMVKVHVEVSERSKETWYASVYGKDVWSE